MSNVAANIDALLSSTPDLWQEAAEGLAPGDSLDGVLPSSRALPDLPAAQTLAGGGQPASQALLASMRAEVRDTLVLKNALFLLMYFDSLFIYRELKALYRAAPEAQQRWIDVACRKVLLRCLEVPADAHTRLTREIVRHTSRGRLATTELAVGLAADLFAQHGRKIVIRDMAVSDGVTTLDLAEAAARRGVPVSITGTDLQLHLLHAMQGSEGIVSLCDGTVLQCVIAGITYGVRHADLSTAPAGRLEVLAAELRGSGGERVTMLAPQVEQVAASGQFDLRFRQEDAFNPHPDIGEADIIRIANLLVERTDRHRGYYCRSDIVEAIARLGSRAKGGAYLLLNNFMQKTEHVGLRKKEKPSPRWVRVPVSGPFREDLSGVSDIPIGPTQSREMSGRSDGPHE